MYNCIFFSYFHQFLFLHHFFPSANFLKWATSAQIVGVEALRPGIGLPTKSGYETA